MNIKKEQEKGLTGEIPIELCSDKPADISTEIPVVNPEEIPAENQADIRASLQKLLDDLTENDAEYRAAAIRELSAIMEEEDAKPEKEKDYGLIAECAEMTAELKGLKTEFSDEELHALAQQVEQRLASNKKPQKYRQVSYD